MPSILSSLPAGTLVDRDIKAAADAGELITAHFDGKRVRQACYELRASDVFYDLASEESKRRQVVTPPARGYLLGPRRYVVSIVQETIELPGDLLGRILTKGQLMSLGLLPVNTYADPGFHGRLGITMFNASNRYIWIVPGEPIAKIEFSKLEKAVDHPYSGQHGYETNIWPFPIHLYATNDEVRDSGVVQGSQQEVGLSHGDAIASLMRKMEFYERRVWLQIGILIAGFAVLSVLYGQIAFLVSVGVGVGSNIATHIGMRWWEMRSQPSG